jgi:hypothetical protein
MPSFVSNARFLPGHPNPVEALLRDLEEGLRYSDAGAEKTFAWGITYEDLDVLPFIHRAPHNRFGWPVYRFDKPMRLGALEIAGLQVNVPDRINSPNWRLDVPIHNFPFEVRLEGDTPDNYWQLKAYLQAALGEPVACWERVDQLHSEWNADGLLMGTTYWFKSDINKQESGFASLNITNERVFPEYFQDTYVGAWTKALPGMMLELFQVPYCTVSSFYRTSQCVRFTPEPLQEVLKNQGMLAVWVDLAHRKMGFAANSQFCMVVDLAKGQRYVLELVDLDRGQSAHELSVVRSNGSSETILSAGQGALDGVVGMLEKAGLRIDRK